jgi:hypothetical protein
MMKKLFLFTILCVLILVSKAQVVSLNAAEITKLKKLVNTDAEVKKHWEGILKNADDALAASPNPADTILTEGILQGDPRKTRTWMFLEDMQKVYALSLAYKVTQDQQYLTKSVAFLLAWAKQNQPMGNPINDTNLDRIIFAYDLLKSDLTTDANLTISAWLNKVALQEIKTYDRAVANVKGITYVNNWHSHRIKEVAQVAWAINDEKLKSWTREAYKLQISKNLNPDGSSLDFHERDALHYHVYDVDPLMVAATILARDKQFDGNPYTYKSAEGNSLKGAVDWLVPYFTGARTHAEFVNSKTPFDKKRAANGEKGYVAGTLFNPSEASSSIALADYFDIKMLEIYQVQTKNKSKYPNWQFVLNEIKR